jgi:hypothetical protein
MRPGVKVRCHYNRCTRCNKCQPGCCKQHYKKSSVWLGYATKGKDKVGAPLQGSRNKGKLAGEEVIELKRPCEANTSNMVNIDAHSKTCVAA